MPSSVRAGAWLGEEQAMERESVRTMADPSISLYWPRIKHQVTDEHPWHTKATMCRTHDFQVRPATP